MTLDEKTKFILDLTADVTTSILDRVADMPDDWDGFELRRYIADKFELESDWNKPTIHGFSRNRRLLAYIEECRTRNL